MNSRLEVQAFRQWLESGSGLSKRSVADIASRLRRVTGLIDLSEVKSELDLKRSLENTAEFQSYSVPVRSQLKRAASLYLEFVTKSGDRTLSNGGQVSFVDLFSGAGGLSLGLSQAGWKPLLAVDNWGDAVKTYRVNFKDHQILSSDISLVSGDELVKLGGARPTWLVGGPPCQGFSTVGRRERTDPRNFLVREFARLASELRPEGVLMENVLGLRDMKFVSFVRELFMSVGYFVTPLILSAADYGVPQLRRRVFFIGRKDEMYFVPPRPTHTAEDYISVWDSIGDLPAIGPGESRTMYDRPPVTPFQEQMRAGSPSLQGHQASKHPASLVEAISHIPDGGNRGSIPDHLQPRSGFHNSYSRLHSGSPAVAVTQNMGKPSGTRCIHPFQNRGLTAREGARLQTFPDTFHFSGGITSQRLQVANAVPPTLARRLAWALQDEDQWVGSEKRLRSSVAGTNQLSLLPESTDELAILPARKQATHELS